MKNEPTVKTAINGVEVEGIITHRSASEIGIRIEKPYQNISGGSHIPCFARTFHSFDGEDGDYAAKHILEQLFSIGSYLYQNSDNLKEKLICVKDRIDSLAVQLLDPDRFNEEQRQLKIMLKNGKIDNKEYQNKLHPLRKKLKQFDSAAQASINEFFEQFPMVVPVGTREEVLDIIDGKKSLTLPSIEQGDLDR